LVTTILLAAQFPIGCSTTFGTPSKPPISFLPAHSLANIFLEKSDVGYTSLDCPTDSQFIRIVNVSGASADRLRFAALATGCQRSSALPAAGPLQIYPAHSTFTYFHSLLSLLKTLPGTARFNTTIPKFDYEFGSTALRIGVVKGSFYFFAIDQKSGQPYQREYAVFSLQAVMQGKKFSPFIGPLQPGDIGTTTLEIAIPKFDTYTKLQNGLRHVLNVTFENGAHFSVEYIFKALESVLPTPGFVGVLSFTIPLLAA